MTFKIKLSVSPKYKDFIPKITFSGIEFNDTIYEGATAYHPIWKPGAKKIIYFNVYFYTDSGYWKFINRLTVKDFKECIKPRLKDVKNIKGL